MPQKLSAMRYIKNNRRRIAVLIVSLALCFVAIYLTQFLLSSTEETSRSLLVDNMRKIQFISLAGSSLGIDVEHLSDEEINAEYEEKIDALAQRLGAYDGVKKVYYAPVLYVDFQLIVGSVGVEIPLLPGEELPAMLEYFDAELFDGRLPESPGEIVLDSASMKNNGYQIGDYINEQDYGRKYRVVGILQCSSYFGCGIPIDGWNWNQQLVMLSEEIDDMSAVLREEGVIVRENFDTVADYVHGEKVLKEEVTEVIGGSVKIVYIGISVLLLISLTLVYMVYLRDRHNEWCLYCSIGFSRKELYLSILRELLFVFASGLLLGGVVIVVSVIVLKYALLEPQGLRCRFFYPQTLSEIVCLYVFLFGVLQIPVRWGLFRIRTIDVMDDELY